MPEKDHPKTLHALLREYASAEELAGAIDRAMLSMVLLLRYEPEQIESLIRSYESLYELRNLILQQEPYQR
ncbi:MAG: hypothetical protein K2X86_15620 [Cytophagaceae bacterium]|nr:hypothetical protein [Cytophagaceae bacterium]